jgi:CheY-like chemotaxis protein
MPQSIRKQRVLIADDEKNIADTLALILGFLGFEATPVYSGEAAVDAAAKFLPDVLITDVIMGEMSGIEAAVLISQMLPQCKIILFSGQAATADLVSQAGSSIHRFEILSKPVHPHVLVDRIKSIAPFPPDRLSYPADYKSAIGS